MDVCAVPVLPPSVTPSMRAERPVPSCTTVCIICCSCLAVASEIGVDCTVGFVLESTCKSRVITSFTM